MKHPTQRLKRTVPNYSCDICKSDIYRASWQIKRNINRFCSRKCYFKYRKGLKTYSGKLDGIRLSPLTEFKKGQNLKENNVNWKGDKVGYHGLHKWIYKILGKPKKCEFCGSTKNIQWANKSYEYKRKIDDWLELCCKCHREKDKKDGWGLATVKYPEIRRRR